MKYFQNVVDTVRGTTYIHIHPIHTYTHTHIHPMNPYDTLSFSYSIPVLLSFYLILLLYYCLLIPFSYSIPVFLSDLMSPSAEEQHYKNGMRKDPDGFMDIEWCETKVLHTWNDLRTTFQLANARKAIAPTQFNPMSTR
jgi:hypothetical protein